MHYVQEPLLFFLLMVKEKLTHTSEPALFFFFVNTPTVQEEKQDN